MKKLVLTVALLASLTGSELCGFRPASWLLRNSNHVERSA